MLVAVNEMAKGGYSVGEVDSVTGTLIGRPKSATFRTLDVVGLDTFSFVAENVAQKSEGDGKAPFLKSQAFMKKMLDNGWLGSKAKQGFYYKKGKEILEIDPETLTYQRRKSLSAPSINLSKSEKDLSKG